jgi:ribosome-associated translation inhibitor RaiA
MPQALQVSFRRLFPNEGLVGLAATRYRQLGAVVRGSSQCLVSLETLDRRATALTLAQVRLERDGQPSAHAQARHRDPFAALDAALTSLEAQLRGARWQH